MTSSLRTSAAARLATSLSWMQRGATARAPDSRALALRAALRRGVHGSFGDQPTADAALLSLLPLPAEDGEPPPLDARLGRLLDDALLVAALVAATRVPVYEPAPRDGRRAGASRRSLGRDLRAIRARRPTASDDLLSAMLRASREQLPRHLRRALTLMADDGAALDVYTLVCDLAYWDSDDHWVQKRWAYHFWSQAEARDDDNDGHDEGTA